MPGLVGVATVRLLVLGDLAGLEGGAERVQAVGGQIGVQVGDGEACRVVQAQHPVEIVGPLRRRMKAVGLRVVAVQGVTSRLEEPSDDVQVGVTSNWVLPVDSPVGMGT